jgi:hypothetical protein
MERVWSACKTINVKMKQFVLGAFAKYQ